jgi:hypothetical protein
MSNNPIVVSSKPFDTSGTVKGPIVVTTQEGDSGDTTPRLGYNQPTYKVRLVANGKTFNMLLPPSIESKHPGRSNPLQLPGLQIKAGVNISKLKIPGFFPIYQNLGVESLTISMSGMFTGYDGVNSLAAANWENAVGIGQSEVQQGQDSFASASELYDFAVSNKALVQVTIYTSDSSFIPKQSASTTFRDTSSNISFKGYIKEFEQVYIRQDRNYYMLKFEIIDFNTNKCKAVVKSDKTTDKANAQLPTIGACIDKLSTASIRDIQTVLKQKGVYSGPIDGQNNAAFNTIITSRIRDNNITTDASCNYISGDLINQSLADLFRVIIPSPINLNNNNSNVIDINGNPIKPLTIQEQAKIASNKFDKSKAQKDFALFAIDINYVVGVKDVINTVGEENIKDRDINIEIIKYIGNEENGFPVFKGYNQEQTIIYIGRYIFIPNTDGSISIKYKNP